jgi:multisubunit Na+/H+ antiporter MnhC subunit
MGPQAYELRSRSGDVLLLTCAGTGLHITGQCQDDTYSLIQSFAAASGGELLQEGELLGKHSVVPAKVIEGEFIQRADRHTAPVRGWGMYGGQAVFRQFNFKPVPKAFIIPAVVIFFPVALAVMLLLMMLMFGKLAFHLIRLRQRQL